MSGFPSLTSLCFAVWCLCPGLWTKHVWAPGVLQSLGPQRVGLSRWFNMSVHKLGKTRHPFLADFTLFLDVVSLVSKASCLGGHISPLQGSKSWGAWFGTWIPHASGPIPLRSFSLWILAAGVWLPPPQVRSSLCLFYLPQCCPLTSYVEALVSGPLSKESFPMWL